MNTAATTHVLRTKANETWPEDPTKFSVVETLRIGYKRYAVGGVTAEGEQRLAMEGHVVKGKSVYTFQHATVIAAVPLKDDRTYLDVALGDYVLIDGNVYRIDPAPNGNIHLSLTLGVLGCGEVCGCHEGTYSCTTKNEDTGRWEFRATPCACR